MILTDLAVIPDLDALDPGGTRACLWTDVEMFPEDEEGRAAALAVCAECPVRAECESAARTIPNLLGVWGGTDEDDRGVLDLDIPDPALYPQPCTGCGCRMRRRGYPTHTDLRPHTAHGLCSSCHARARREAQR